MKRLLDLLAAALALLLLLLPLLALAWLIRRKLGSPVLFCQVRPGLQGRPFTMFKFRTMTDERGSVAALLSDAQRLTPLGRFLRSSSLDELPELWNVLRGEMSLVGPRPEEERIVQRYQDFQRRRLAVKPGMTGPMQVNGRGDLAFGERLQLELEYIDHYSLRRDFEILLRTFPTIFQGHGAR